MNAELRYVLAPVFRYVGLAVLLGALAFAGDRVAFLQRAHAVQGVVTAERTEPRPCDDGGRGRGGRRAAAGPLQCFAYIADLQVPGGEAVALQLGVGLHAPKEFTSLGKGAHLDVLVDAPPSHRVMRNDWWPLWSLPAALVVLAAVLFGFWFAFSRPPRE